MTGRPSSFTPEIGNEICERIACGQSLKSICRDEEMPPERTVMRWLQVNDAFRQQYARARSEQADADADAIGDIAERVLRGEVEPNAGRVAIDALKWSAGKRKPKKYGDKLAIGGDRNMDPISTVDLTNLSDEQLAALKAVFGPLAGGANDDDAPDSAGRGSEAS